MAADDNDDRGAAPDPWDEIVAESLGDNAGEVSFRFEEEPAAVEPAADAPETVGTSAESTPSDGEAEAAEAADHALVEDWLSGDEGDAGSEVPPLTVFTPEDAAGGSSAIDIGTGTSGITLHGDAMHEDIGTDPLTDSAVGDEAADAGWPGIDTAAAEAAADGGAEPGFPDVGMIGAPAAAAGAAAKTVRLSSKPAKKSGGIGQMIGVGLGGAMAIPITLAILIYGLGKDPFGVTKALPRQVSFLLPQKFRPGYKKPSAPSALDNAVAGGSALDDLPSRTEPEEPAAEPAAVDGATDVAAPDDLVDAGADVPPVVEPEPQPTPEPAMDAVAADAPALDALAALDAAPAPAPEPLAPPEPPPLDTAALDKAVGEAAALGEALGVVDDKENRAYTTLRTDWYKALARVAEELVAVDNQAATSGRPLVGAPANVEELHSGIGGREALVAELAALAPDWLAYAKRGSDGVVLPVTFESARKVGPLWTVRVTLTGADGQPRDLTVISRREPAAIAGDRLVVTGVALDGTAIWAADVRSAESAAGF